MRDAALRYLDAGLCVLPARRDQKRPTVPWKAFQSRLPTAAELDAWFANGQTGLCILTGKVSGNHELIDFDQRGALFDPWCAKVNAVMPGIVERLVVCKTQNDGRHVPYRVAGEVCGNMKLAQRRGEDGKVVTLIETRGEGGLYLCVPTPGYTVIQGDLCSLPVLSEEERDVLLQAAWELNEHLPPVVDGPQTGAAVRPTAGLSAENGLMSADPANNGHSPEDNSHSGATPANKSNNVPTSTESAQRGPTWRETGPTVADNAALSANSAAGSAENPHNAGLSADNAACATDRSSCASNSPHSEPCATDTSHSRGLPADNPASPADNADRCRSLADNSHPGGSPSHRAERPGDDFNIRGDVRAVLEQHGWQRTKGGENEHWRRPDKTCGSNSATLKDRVFYVFSSNAAPFQPNQGYSPFAVYTLLEHRGNFEQAARSLRTLGYGGDCPSDSAAGTDISAIVGQVGLVSANSAATAATPESPMAIRSLRELIEGFTGLHPPVIRGLLREGETMNIIASSKVGKSWLVSGLAIAVASGRDWLGFAVERGRVLHIDNELHVSTTTYRYGVISEAMQISHTLYSDHIDLVSLRGQLRDLEALGRYFEGIAPGYYKLVIIDAFYRTLPRNTDENDNGAVAGLYNLIDRYAAHLGCAFVLIHHSSKGNQAGKAVTDVGAGAGSQSRAADTHLVLRPHEEDGIFVVEAAVRSWPPIEPLALRWQWPLFTPTTQVDTSALLGAVKPKTAKADDVPLEEFVEQCVALNDPCSQRSVKYEARQRFGLSDRKAEETLDLAIERGLATKIRAGSYMCYVRNRPGIVGEKGLWVAALLAHAPEADLRQIAEKVGVSERYVRQIRQDIDTPSAELERN